MVSSGSRKLFMRGRLTIICWTAKLSGVTVKSLTRPRREPFLVSTLRLIRLKLREMTSEILTTSSGETSSSMESTIMPRWEYSRIEETVIMSAVDFLSRGPERRKARILRVVGSMIMLATVPMEPVDWTLITGVSMSLPLVTNILSL